MEEVKYKLIAKYKNIGSYDYPEDTWETNSTIENKEDLLAMFKSIYRNNAYSFNNYPMNGEVQINNFEFLKKPYVKVSGRNFYSELIPTETPEFFNDVVAEYKDYKKRIFKTLTHLRKAKREKETRSKELLQLKRLKQKYKL